MVKNIKWTIQANLKSSSDPNAKLLYQISGTVNDGYVNFTNLAISSVNTNNQFSITYGFVLPDGVDA